MDDPNKFLNGTVEEVKNKVRKRNNLDYNKLLSVEKANQNRDSMINFLQHQKNESQDDISAEPVKEEKNIDYRNLSDKTVKKIKSEVEENHDIDLLKLLEAEKVNQDREVLLNWIRNRIRGEEEDKEEKQIENSYERFESKMKDTIQNIKNPQDKIEQINDEVKDKVGSKGRTVKRKNQEKAGPVEKTKTPKEDEKHDSKAGVEEEDVSVPNKSREPGDSIPEKKAKEKLKKDSEENYEEFEKRIEKHGQNFNEIRDMLQKVIVGQEEPVEKVLIALMCDGNVLLEGVPGLGKSLLVETLSRTISSTEFNRIQFVPDMLPSDILGQRVYNQDKGEFYINKGPVFANFLLADEINRAPPKTQAAMMEVMQEKKVSIEKEEFQLEPPYLVLATQNPLEQKGTYPLPEAVIDRFFMKLVLDYPDSEEEVEILQRNSIKDVNPFSEVDEVVSKKDIIQVQKDVRNIYISPDVQKYIVELITTARGDRDNGVDSMSYVDFGPSPRASIWLSLGASAYAILDGRTYVIPDDVKKIAKPILRHRILLNYEGKISEYSTDDVIEEILGNVDTV